MNVTLFDIASRSVYRTMAEREASTDVAAALELGDTIQEYDTTDRAGAPLRVVLHISADTEDIGGVYAFAI